MRLLIIALLFTGCAQVQKPVTVKMNEIVFCNGMMSGMMGKPGVIYDEYAYFIDQEMQHFEYTDSDTTKELFFKVVQMKEVLSDYNPTSYVIMNGWAKYNEEFINKVWMKATITFTPRTDGKPIKDFSVAINVPGKISDYSEVPDSLRTEYRLKNK